MSGLTWNDAPVPGGTFIFEPEALTAHHRAIDGLDMLAARSEASRLVEAAIEGGAALGLLGNEPSERVDRLGREGLFEFFRAARLWVAVVQRVTLTRDGEAVEIPFGEADVCRAFVQFPALLMLWLTHTNRHIVSPSEGNAFTLSPNGGTASSGTGAAGAVH